MGYIAVVAGAGVRHRRLLKSVVSQLASERKINRHLHLAELADGEGEALQCFGAISLP
jgi:hypothetical protein